MRLSLFLCLAVLLTPSVAYTFAAQPVYVAVYEFPPYYSSRSSVHITGKLVEVLNKQQNDYQFILREVRPAERYGAIAAGGCCDVIFFESELWGWQESNDYHWGRGLTASAERFYVMREALAAGKVNFDLLAANRIGGVHGYNYNFVDNVTNAEVLEEQFKVYTADSPMSVLHMLVGNRVDIGILNDDFVAWVRHLEFPAVDAIVGSEFVDQFFVTRVVVNAQGKLPASFINNQLQELTENGGLEAILSQFGIASLIYKGTSTEASAN